MNMSLSYQLKLQSDLLPGFIADLVLPSNHSKVHPSWIVPGLTSLISVTGSQDWALAILQAHH